MNCNIALFLTTTKKVARPYFRFFPSGRITEFPARIKPAFLTCIALVILIINPIADKTLPVSIKLNLIKCNRIYLIRNPLASFNKYQ